MFLFFLAYQNRISGFDSLKVTPDTKRNMYFSMALVLKENCCERSDGGLKGLLVKSIVNMLKEQSC